MKKSKLNIITDAVLFFLIFGLVATGTVIHTVLPPGSGRQTTLISLNRHEWGGVHTYVAIALLGMLSYHLYMHRQWLDTKFFRGAGIVSVILTVAFAVLLLAGL